MSIFTSITQFVAQASPFRKRPAPSLQGQEGNDAKVEARARPIATSRLGPGGLATPVTSEKSNKRKRAQELPCTPDFTGRSGLLTPSSYDEEEVESPTRHRNKRSKTDSQTPILESIEHEPTQQPRLPTFGATRPWASHPQQVTPSAWKAERNERLAEVEQLRERGWCESDIALFRKISLRSFEPLLPAHWQIDFNALPDSLFTDSDDAYIKPFAENEEQTSDFRASKKLWSLIDLGVQVRDDRMLSIKPHRRIAKAARNFLDWSLEGANLNGKRGVLPLTVVCSASEYVSAEAIHKELIQKLGVLADAWREALKEGHKHQIPPLYGIAVSDTAWAIVSYVPDGKSQAPEAQKDPDNFSTLMHTFNFITTGQEVWVALAFAIFAVHCRDELMEVLDKGLVPAYDGMPLPSPSDPDE